MNATISMDGLWAIIGSLSRRNKKWLADKILADLEADKSSTEEKVLTGIAKSVQEAKAGNTQPLDTLWSQL